MRERWFGKGVLETNGGMLEQATYSIALGEKHKEKLATRGFGAEPQARMVTSYDELKSLLGERGEMRADKQLATRNEGAAIDAAKTHIALLSAALPILLRDKEQTSLVPAEIMPRGKLKRSTAKVMKYLTETHDLIARLDSELKPYFEGGSALEAHEKVTNDLTNANTDQGTKTKALPYETRLIHETKGALLELIEDMNRIGRFVYRGQAELAAQFNKDILFKARRKSAKPAPKTSDETGAEKA